MGKLESKVSDEDLDALCKIGQGKACCRYLVMGTGGFECIKLTSMKSTVDEKVELGEFNAQGDNCDGR